MNEKNSFLLLSTTTIVTTTLLLSTGNHGYLNNFFTKFFYVQPPLIFFEEMWKKWLLPNTLHYTDVIFTVKKKIPTKILFWYYPRKCTSPPPMTNTYRHFFVNWVSAIDKSGIYETNAKLPTKIFYAKLFRIAHPTYPSVRPATVFLFLLYIICKYSIITVT